MDQEHSEVCHEEICNNHTPALGLTRNDILLVRVLEEDRILRCSIDWMCRRVADNITSGRSGEDIRPRHEPVAKVIDVARGAPPARYEKFGPSCSFDVLEVLHTRIVRVGAETVLLVVDRAEDVVAECLDGENGHQSTDAELDGVGS